MSIVPFSKFTQYKEKLAQLTIPLEAHHIMTEQFLLEKDERKNLEVYYAPFEYVNERAKVVIAGITPGLHQMKRSYATVAKLRERLEEEEFVLHEVKKNSSFEGSMRKNLIGMLDQLNLPDLLGISSTSELFSSASHLVQTNSVLSYPVFYKGKNYSGSTPHILKTELLKKYIIENYTKELSFMDDPLFIPLGVNVSMVLRFLAEEGYLNQNSILYGFPHPSGSNGHRHRQFAENQEAMKQKLRKFF